MEIEEGPSRTPPGGSTLAAQPGGAEARPGAVQARQRYHGCHCTVNWREASELVPASDRRKAVPSAPGVRLCASLMSQNRRFLRLCIPKYDQVNRIVTVLKVGSAPCPRGLARASSAVRLCNNVDWP